LTLHPNGITFTPAATQWSAEHTLAHYRILEKIGSGGMGDDVYIAEDTKLDRRVALKALRPELAENEERRARFQREAKASTAAAAAQVPGVCIFEFDIGSHPP